MSKESSSLPQKDFDALPKQESFLPMEKVEAAIRSIRHGYVQVIIQDGQIVQIDKTEKIRLR